MWWPFFVKPCVCVLSSLSLEWLRIRLILSILFGVSMDPSHSELSQIATDALPLQALLDFIGMDEPVKAALWDTLGGVSKVREIVPFGDDAVKDALTTTAAVEASEGVVGQPAQTRELKPIEKAQVGMLRRYARLLSADSQAMKLEGVFLGAWNGAGNCRQCCCSDGEERAQADVQTVECCRPGGMIRKLKRFPRAISVRFRSAMTVSGADEEATPVQLQGISVKLEQDVVLNADFGVLRPFGQRLERTLNSTFGARIQSRFLWRRNCQVRQILTSGFARGKFIRSLWSRFACHSGQVGTP